MLEPTNEQLKELHKDIMSGSVMTITTEHYKQQAERIKELENKIQESITLLQQRKYIYKDNGFKALEILQQVLIGGK